MLHHEQNIWKMAASPKNLPITFLTFSVGRARPDRLSAVQRIFSAKTQSLRSPTNATAIFMVALLTAFLTRILRLAFACVVHLAPRSRKSSRRSKRKT